jgi:Cu/Ag efflux protein CusF
MIIRNLASLLAAAALLCACAGNSPMGGSTKPSGRMEEATQARATVTAVDPSTRTVSLKEASGEELDVVVTDAVKNLDQIKPGDEVVVTYTEALAWQVKPAAQGAPGASANVSGTTAKPGEKPSASGTRAVTVTATITAIDPKNGTVTITGPTGRTQTVKARDPNNLKQVQVGDLVDITYSEAVALAVKPAPSK